MPGEDALSISANFSCVGFENFGGRLHWLRNTTNMSEAVVTQAPAATETVPVKGMKKNGMRHVIGSRDIAI